ncbi:hypothetical protein ACQCT5_19070 [Sutcliffiella halmapala]
MKEEVRGNKYIDIMANNLLRNIIVYILNKNSYLIMVPFIIIIIYFYFLYNHIFLVLNNVAINSEDLLRAISTSIILTINMVAIFSIALSVLFNIIYNSFIKKSFFFPIDIYQSFVKIENKIIAILLLFFSCYIITFIFALNNNLIEKLFFLAGIIFTVYVTFKFSNIIIFIFTFLTASNLPAKNIPVYYWIIFYQITFFGVYIKVITLIQQNLHDNYYIVFLMLIIFIIGRILSNKFIKSFYSPKYIKLFLHSKKVTVIEKKLDLDKKIKFNMLTLLRNKNIIISYFIMSSILIIILKYLGLLINNNVYIISSVIISPILFSIKENFRNDYIRFPINKLVIYFYDVIISIIVSGTIFMFLVTVSRGIIFFNDILLFFSLLCLSISLQIVIKIPFNPNNQSSIYFFGIFSLFSQCIIFITHFFELPIVILFIVSLITLICILFYGGKNETSKKF